MIDLRDHPRKTLVTGAGIALAVAIIMPFEGRPVAGYFDPSHIPSNCWGHTGADVVVGRVESLEHCKALLTADVRAHAAPLARCITAPISAQTFGAMVSFAYNAGPGTVCKSFAPLLNTGRPYEACAKLSLYVYSRDRRSGQMVKLPGLVRRRAAERALCEKGI